MVGDQEKLVRLELLRFAANHAAVSLETAFAAKNEMAKLKIESGLSATNRLRVGLIVAVRVKRGKTGFAFTELPDEIVKLLDKIDIGHVLADVDVIDRCAIIETDIETTPVARIGCPEFLQKFTEIRGQSRRWS